MKILKTTKRKTITEKITHQTDKGFNIVETLTNGKQSGFNITCKDSKDIGSPIMLDLPDSWIDDYTEYRDLFKHEFQPMCIEDIDEDKVFFAYSNGHMLFDKDKKIKSIPYIFNYIGSLKEKRPNDPLYAKLIELLKKHPYVVSLEEEEIPYYNCSFNGQKAIGRAKVLIPQDVYEKLYNQFKDIKTFWSVRMGDFMKLSYYQDNWLYGEEIEKLLNEYNDSKEEEDDYDEY